MAGHLGFSVFSLSGSIASPEDLNLLQSAEKIIQVLFPTSALSLQSELNQTHHVLNIRPEFKLFQQGVEY